MRLFAELLRKIKSATYYSSSNRVLTTAIEVKHAFISFNNRKDPEIRSDAINSLFQVSMRFVVDMFERKSARLC